jgi:hypothetical protein
MAALTNLLLLRLLADQAKQLLCPYVNFILLIPLRFSNSGIDSCWCHPRPSRTRSCRLFHPTSPNKAQESEIHTYAFPQKTLAEMGTRIEALSIT